MSAVDEIISQIPLSSLASRLGVDEATAERAARQALPALLGGLEANARDPQGAASLAQALTRHDSSLVDDGVDLDRVDTEDGRKIVSNVFGDKREQVVSTLGGAGLGGSLVPGGVGGGGMIAKLLPMLAPIVMAYLAKKAGAGAAGAAPKDGGGGLGDLLGGLLGGGSGSSGGGGGLGDILGGLGGLLGGGKR